MGRFRLVLLFSILLIVWTAVSIAVYYSFASNPTPKKTTPLSATGSDTAPAFKVTPNDEVRILGGAHFYVGQVADVVVISRQNVSPDIVEYVFRRKIAGGENYFRVQFAYDYPDSGGWEDNNWLMNYDVEWPPTGSTTTVYLVGLRDSQTPKSDLGKDWPPAYRKVYGNLKAGQRKAMEKYFESGSVDKTWPKDPSGIIDLRSIVGVKRVAQYE